MLCRLFRKHDDNPGNSNGDDVDRGVASPPSIDIVRSTTDGPSSEPATPIMIAPPDAESIDPAILIAQTNNYNIDSSEYQLPDSGLEEALQGFCNTTPQHLDLKILSPVFSPMHLEHGSPYLGNRAAGDSDNRHNVMQYGTDTQDLMFLNTILTGPDQTSFEDSQASMPEVRPKENESNSESEGKMVQGQHLATGNPNNRRPLHMGYQEYIATYSCPVFDAGNAETLILHRRDIPEVNGSSPAPTENQVNVLVKEEFCHPLAPASDNDFGTGIKRRARQQQMVTSGSTINNQGTAQRRLRLQMKLGGSVGHGETINLSLSGERCEGKPRVSEVTEKQREVDQDCYCTSEMRHKVGYLHAKDSSFIALYMLKLLVLIGLCAGVVGLWRCPTF